MKYVCIHRPSAQWRKMNHGRMSARGSQVAAEKHGERWESGASWTLCLSSAVEGMHPTIMISSCAAVGTQLKLKLLQPTKDEARQLRGVAHDVHEAIDVQPIHHHCHE